MTREEAICELSVIWERLSHPEDCENGCYSFRDGDYLEALDMAIEALSNQQKWIDEELQNYLIENADLVTCKDCKHYEFADNRAFGMPVKYCDWFGFEDVDDNDFCSRAERRE